MNRLNSLIPDKFVEVYRAAQRFVEPRRGCRTSQSLVEAYFVQQGLGVGRKRIGYLFLAHYYNYDMRPIAKKNAVLKFRSDQVMLYRNIIKHMKHLIIKWSQVIRFLFHKFVDCISIHLIYISTHDDLHDAADEQLAATLEVPARFPLRDKSNKCNKCLHNLQI